MHLGPWATVAAGLPHGGAVLELGCGAGVPTAKAIIADPRELRVIGVDISERQIVLARGLLPSERATFECADMGALAFDDGSFDAICAFFSVFHLPRAEHFAFFLKVSGWLRPGGSFVFNLGTGDDDGEGEAYLETDFLGATMLWSSFGSTTTVGLLEAAGLEMVSVETKMMMQTDGVDEEAHCFTFYTCRKPAPNQWHWPVRARR